MTESCFDSSYAHLANKPLRERVEFALAKIEVASNALVGEIEERSPGHAYGIGKAMHMRHLASEASEIGKLVELSGKGVNLLRVVLRVHDFGRHIEALRGGIPTLGARRHGYDSVRLLNRFDANTVIPAQDWRDLSPESKEVFTHPVLKVFTPEERYVINYAVFWHAERRIPVVKPNAPDYVHLANKICYLLRDLDKEDILLDPRYFDPGGVYGQLKLFYLDKDEVVSLSADPTASEAVMQAIGSLLHSNQISPDNQVSPELYTKITAIMNRGITETAWSYFRNRQTVPLEEIKYSWATYAFMHLAMLFDIRLPGMLRKIYESQDRYLGKRLDFIRLKAGGREYEEITQRLTDYFQARLGIED